MSIWEFLANPPQPGDVPIPPQRFVLPKGAPQFPPPQQPVMPNMETVPAGPVEPPTLPAPLRGPANVAQLPKVKNGLGLQNQAALDQLIGAQEDQVKQQQQLVGQAEDLQPQMDLRPLAAFVDNLTGAKHSSASAPTFSQADKLKLISSLRENVAQGQEKITSTRLRQMLGEGNLDMRGIAALMAANRGVANQDQKDQTREDKIGQISTKFFETMERHPLMKKLAEQDMSFDQLNGLADLARSGDPVVFSSIGTKMAKAMGEVGALTEKDVTRYVQSKKLTQSAADTLNKWRTGTPTNATLDSITGIADVMKELAHKNVEKLTDRHVKVMMRNFNMTKEEAHERLGIDDSPAEEPAQEAAPKAPSKAASTPSSLTPEQRKRLELLRAQKQAGG